MPETSNAHMDRGYAWFIPFACCFINAILFGIYRSYGILYSAILDEYSISRADATWPFSLCMTVIHLTGPVSGILNSYFTVRSIMLIGCVFAFIGVSLCYFASSVIDISIFIGIIQGFGIGITYVQNQVIINEYFIRYIATANGITQAGGTIGAFIISPIVERSLELFELSRTYLLLGLLTLLTLPVCFMLKPIAERERDHIKNKLKNIYIMQQPVNLIAYKQNEGTKIIAPDVIQYNGERKTSIIEPLRITFQQVSKKVVEIANKVSSHPPMAPSVGGDKKLDMNIENGGSDKGENKPAILASIVEIVTNPCFALVCATHLAYFWGVMTFTMIVVDHAIDKGQSRSDAVYFIASFSGGDLIGRLGSGFFMDRKIFSLRYIAMFSIGFIAIALKIVPYVNGFTPFLICSFNLGFLGGVVIILINVLLSDYLGNEKSALAFGLSCFVCGVATLIRPMVVGFFRDRDPTGSGKPGSYDGLFDLLAIFSFVSMLLWLVEPIAVKYSKSVTVQQQKLSN